MNALFVLVVSAFAGAVLAAATTFTGVQLLGDGSSDEGAISTPLVQYGSRTP